MLSPPVPLSLAGSRTGNVGASGGVLSMTAMSKLLSALAPLRSVAVTLTVIAPASLLPGVPLNVWVAASKVSHDGRVETSARMVL